MRLVIDAHLDLAWNALSYNRDITRELAEVRRDEAGMTDDSSRGRSTVSLPEMRRGGVALCIATLLARSGPTPPGKPPTGRLDLDYASPAIASAVAWGQLAYYEMLEAAGEIRIIRTKRDLEEHWKLWQVSIPKSEIPIGVIIGMECADPILDPAQLQQWYDRGLRNIEPAHTVQSRYAAGNSVDGPLTDLGVELLKEMRRLNMILDVTHLSDRSMSQALDTYDGPVIASHHNCRAIVPGHRQLSDDQIKRLVSRGAVIGVATYNPMLAAGWKAGAASRESVTFDTIADHIDHVCQIAGNANHVAVGSDLDGGFGNEATPLGLDSIADLHKLAEPLARRGYSEPDINNIFHNNWLGVFRAALPE